MLNPANPFFWDFLEEKYCACPFCNTRIFESMRRTDFRTQFVNPGQMELFSQREHLTIIQKQK